MDFAWDETKRRANLGKHGLDFQDVADLDWANATIVEDTRKDYGERRFIAFAHLGKRLCVVAFTPRGSYRIISFRKASGKEVARYGKVAKAKAKD